MTMTRSRTGIGFDMHRFVAGRKLVLGGVTVKHKAGLAGHSDADVLCHAVIDALLGSVADGNIGTHFKNTDRRWKNVRSLNLLRAVAARLAKKGFSVVNVDSTIIAQAPKLMPHSLKMRKNIAGAMGVPVNCVSVKATTAEHMGALGREEGIAAMAVAMVERVRTLKSEI